MKVYVAPSDNALRRREVIAMLIEEGHDVHDAGNAIGTATPSTLMVAGLSTMMSAVDDSGRKCDEFVKDAEALEGADAYVLIRPAPAISYACLGWARRSGQTIIAATKEDVHYKSYDH